MFFTGCVLPWYTYFMFAALPLRVNPRTNTLRWKVKATIKKNKLGRFLGDVPYSGIARFLLAVLPTPAVLSRKLCEVPGCRVQPSYGEAGKRVFCLRLLCGVHPTFPRLLTLLIGALYLVKNKKEIRDALFCSCLSQLVVAAVEAQKSAWLKSRKLPDSHANSNNGKNNSNNNSNNNNITHSHNHSHNHHYYYYYHYHSHHHYHYRYHCYNCNYSNYGNNVFTQVPAGRGSALGTRRRAW